MIYFTSDLHLGHENVIKFQNRPFADANEMNHTLIINYNSIVQPNDTVYILGDLVFRIPADDANRLISKMNGKKYLITGNHDKKYDESLFEEITIYKEIKYCRERFVLMHYPLLEWNHMYHGSYHLHGHIHSFPDYNIKNKNDNIRRYDVGVDANYFYPVAITDILNFFNN